MATSLLKKLSKIKPGSRNNNSDIIFEKNKITFKNLNHHKVVADLIRNLKESNTKGIRNFELDFQKCNPQIFPGTITPISAILAYYKKLGFQFHFKF